MKSSDISSMQFMVILVLIHTFISDVSLDPRAIIYKGKVNIGLLISAHSSTSSQSLCNTISVNGLHNSMANVWSLHMYNQRQRLNSFDEIGVYIYDTCADETVAQRQTVRLISHLYNVGNRICRESKAYPPLIGVIIDGQTYDKSVDLLHSFNIPVIITSEDSHSHRSNASNVFSVAPNLEELSKSVMSLVKELDLKSVSLVVSDVDPVFDSQLLYLLSASAQNIVKEYDSDTISSDYKKKEKTLNNEHGYIWKRYRRSDKETVASNTIFYLSPSEAIDLLNSLSGTVDDYNGMTSNYTYIIVTKSDISAQIKTSNDLKRREKLRKNVFLVSPLMENTNEYQKYFQTMVNTIGIKGEQPLIAEYRKANQPNVPDMSVALMAKAVWSLTQAYQNLFQKQCAGNKMNCNLETNNNLTNLMTKSLKNMNTVITGSGLKDVDGIRLRFDSEHKLISWKYQIMIMSSNWQTISLGYYSADTLLNIDSKFLKTILTNRINRYKNRPKSMIKALTKSVTSNTLSPLSTNGFPLYKQAVYTYDNDSISPSNLMRSSIRHQISASSAPIERITYSDDSYKYNSSTRPPNSDSSHVTRRRYNGLTAWLGTFWSMTILSTSILGILITLYIQTFLLMKSCEGALRKTNQALVISHLIAVTVTFLGSSLFVFYPTLTICCLRHTIHNISLSLLFGSLLIRAMYIRAQKSIGLGGRTSRLNQFLTLIFIIGIQTAIEFQKWKYEFSWISSESPSNLASLCIHDGYEYMRSQIYLAIILSLLLMMCWSARNTPFNQKEGIQSLIVSLLITVVFIISMIAVMNINRSKYNDIIISISMNVYAFCVLLGLFVPLLHTLHKYGVLVPKSGSYADSLSTIFTSFGTHDLNDSFSHNSSQSQKSKQFFNPKISKSYDFQNTNNFFARVSPNCYSNPIPNPYKFDRNKCSLMHNTLYEGVPGFRSAYP